jgi:hypothetical protein
LLYTSGGESPQRKQTFQHKEGLCLVFVLKGVVGLLVDLTLYKGFKTVSAHALDEQFTPLVYRHVCYVVLLGFLLAHTLFLLNGFLLGQRIGLWFCRILGSGCGSP